MNDHTSGPHPSPPLPRELSAREVLMACNRALDDAHAALAILPEDERELGRRVLNYYAERSRHQQRAVASTMPGLV